MFALRARDVAFGREVYFVSEAAPAAQMANITSLLAKRVTSLCEAQHHFGEAETSQKLKEGTPLTQTVNITARKASNITVRSTAKENEN